MKKIVAALAAAAMAAAIMQSLPDIRRYLRMRLM